MDKNNSKNLLALLGGILLMSFPLDVQAQWPTLDIVAIKTAITSNLELVKQSKIVTDATALAGKINSGIGDAKASMSKFAGDNLEKAKEKMKKLQKEKERLDGLKEKYEKAKEFAEKRKAELDEAKAFAAEQKARVAEAKAFAEEKKGEFNDYKSQAEGLKNDVSSGINDAKGMAGDLKNAAEAKKNELKSQAGVTEKVTDEDEYQLPEITSDDKVYEEDEIVFEDELPEEEKLKLKEQEIAEAEEERDAALAYLEQVKAEGGDVAEAEAMLATAESKLDKTYEEQAQETANASSGVNADAMMQDEYEKAAREAGSAGVASDFKVESKASATAESKPEETSELKAEKSQGRKAFGNMDKMAKKETRKEAKATAKLERKTLAKETSSKATMKASSTTAIRTAPVSAKQVAPQAIMRSSPATMNSAPSKVKQEMRATGRKAFQKNSKLNLDKTNKYVSRSFNEKISFAQLGGGMIDNTLNGKLIGPESFFDYCGFSASDAVEKNTKDCLIKLIETTGSENQQEAAAAQALIMEILGEKNIAFAAVGLKATKDISGNDAKQDKLNTSAGQASQGRDDTAALTMNNKETQVLANGLLDVYSAQLFLDSMDSLGNIKADSVTQEPVTMQAKMIDDTFDGKKTVAVAMYELCEFSAKDITETNKVIYDCMKKLIETKSNPDMKIAAEGSRNFDIITANTSLDKIYEGIEALKEVAKNDKNVEKMEDNSGDAKNARMDHAALAATNLQIQFKLNQVLDAYTSQMIMDSLNYMKSVDISAFTEEKGEENG